MKHFGVPGAVRASFAVYNTTDEVDALARGLIRARDMLQ
jgi:cysteine desulfurase/selenocysteine lyase